MKRFIPFIIVADVFTILLVLGILWHLGYLDSWF